jgi:Uma2 family endonuclease
VLKQHLNIAFARRIPETVTFIQEAGWRLGDLLYLEPDYLFFAASRRLAAVKGPEALLVVEVADSSLGYDLGRKPGLYAGEGVAEYWVVDAVSRETHVHLAPSTNGYASVRAYPATVELRPQLIPALAVRMADLPEA